MNIEILDKPLLKSLIDETLSFYEVVNTYNIKTSMAYSLPSPVLGFVYVSKRNNYHLILNANTNHETQCKTFVHEIKHITYDLPEMGYIIGLDMQCTYFEDEANRVAEEVVGYEY